MSPINTARLIIRKTVADDAKSIYRYRSDAIVNQFQGWVPTTLAEVESFIQNLPESILDKVDEWGQLSIVYRGEVIGDIGVKLKDRNTIEVGCTVHQSYHQKGIATEALHAVITTCFKLGLANCVFASIDPNNRASEKLLIRLGFKQIGYFEKSYMHRGEWVDDVHFELK